MSKATSNLDMSPEAMRRLGHKATDILVDRAGRLADGNAWDGEFRDSMEEKFLKPPPEQGRPAEEVLEHVVRDILPYAARLDHPRFFGFVPSSPTWPGIVADYVSAGYHINSCTWLVSSGTSQLELVVTDWMRTWVGYPETAGGLLTSGGSAASVEAIVTAREAAGNPERPTVYMSDQSHSALKRAAHIAGVRRDRVRIVPTDEAFRLDPGELARMVAADRAEGLQPVAVCANAGSVSTGSIDPLQAMADFCRDEGIWLHVDAAYGGFAMVTEIGRDILGGIERADSIGLDAHKWFFQPYEAGALMVKDVRHLENAFAIGHDVLQDTVWGANHPNFSDRGMQLSRTARALKIWMSVQTFGMAAFPSGSRERAGPCPAGGSLRHRQPDSGTHGSGLDGHPVLSREPGRSLPQRPGPGGDQPQSACQRVLGRAGILLLHVTQGRLFAENVHRQPHDNLGRRAPNA